MAILKCKMCGGDLNVSENTFVAVCEFCETKQTIPNADDEKKVNLFRRANKLRLACEFDRAYGVYESIVSEFPDEAEAYWGLVLCKYGIEYVDDPKTGNKIPTCHRTSFESVLDDENYKSVLAKANVVAKDLYIKEAEAIETIRRGIIEISSKEEPYDVFICYKETSPNGERTVDSVLAQDIYKELTREGYKVFFARITLEHKLGVKYEPYIFSALHTSKVMLVVTTSQENVEAVWVKNEWSRYLKLIEAGENKTLIPCYRDIDAYDLPDEFSDLQGQDMSKIGAIQDLIHGISKLIPKGGATTAQQTTTVQAPVSDPNASIIMPLLKRAYIFLQNGEFNKAHEYFEKVLDFSPENQDALMGTILVEMKLKSKEDLESSVRFFHFTKAFNNAVIVLNDESKEYYENLLEKIKENIEQAIDNALDKREFDVAKKLIAEYKKEDSDSELILLAELLATFNKKNLDDLCNMKTIFVENPAYKKLSKNCSDAIWMKLNNAIKAQKEHYRQRAGQSIASFKYNDAAKAISELLKIDNKDEQIATWEFFIECKLNNFDEIAKSDIEYYKLKSYRTLMQYASYQTKTVLEKTKRQRVLILENQFENLVWDYTGKDKCKELVEKCLELDPQNRKALLKRFLLELGFRYVENIQKFADWDDVKRCRSICGTSQNYKALPKDLAKQVEEAIASANKRVIIGKTIKIAAIVAVVVAIIIGISSCIVDCMNEEDYAWTIYNTDGTYYIYEYRGTYSDLVISNTIERKTVTKIGSHAFEQTGVKNVIISEGYKVIGFAAFRNCKKLASVQIPNTVTKIDMDAFCGCDKLKTINIPDSVTSIGSCAFQSCDSLEKIVIPESVKEIGSSAFSGCDNLVIYCEAEEKPEGWATSWKGANVSVVWGYKGE